MSDQPPISDESLENSRRASVQLSSEREQMDGMMDPANQSLAEALRITYRIVQAAMVVLAALFVFSGVQRVDEGESGIPLLLGRPTSTGVLSPGAHFSAPFPLGEIVKVDATTTKLPIMETYWPHVSSGNMEMAADKLEAVPQIAPGRDGSLVTADLNLAHAQWKVDYRRTAPGDYARNIYPEDEDQIVGGVIRSAIVRVVAEVSIDSLLKQTESNEFAVSSRVMSIAQDKLDQLDSGIHIDKVTLYRVTAPAKLRPDFEGVLAAASAAGTAQTKAQSEGQKVLNKVAGLATPDLIKLIKLYEAAVELDQPERADKIMSAINDVFEGRATEFEGISVPANRASGEVTEIISSARTEAVTLRESAEARLKIFDAKVAQFEANPRLMLFRDWVSAYNAFTNKPFVQTEILPAGTDWQMILNADPDISEEIYREINRRKTQEQQEKRLEQIKKGQFDINENAQIEGG